MSFISLDNISFSYSDIESGQPYKNAVDGVSLNIEKGEFVALLGHNGCGKSTVAKHLNAMLLPDKGKVYVDGDDTSDENKTYDIRENLGIPPKEIRQRVDDALKAVDMYDYREHAPFKLSGGQKQRIAIAGILAMQPQCIVLDEPTAMLDPNGRDEVMTTLLKLNREKNMTVVLITHYMEEAVLADRVVVMDAGKILTQGTPEEVFSQAELLKKHRLDVPQATELAYRLRGCGVKFDKLPLNAEQCVKMLEEVLS